MDKPIIIKDLVRELNKTYRDIITQELAQIGLTMPQMLLLKEIKDGRKTIGQISKSVGLSYSTVSGIIDRLEREQLVERIRDEEDRRIIWIQKTKKIEEVIKQVPALNDEFYINLLQGISDNELDNIITSIRLLLTELEKKVEGNHE